MPPPEKDPHAFLKLIDLDLQRRRGELKRVNRGSLFLIRVMAVIFLAGSLVLAWWLLDFGSGVRDRQQKKELPSEAVPLVERPA